MIRSLLLSFLISFVFIGIYIKVFKGVGQRERALGPSSHKYKNGTITMGGILIFISMIMGIFINKFDSYIDILFIIIPGFLFFVIGLIDDMLKVLKNNNDGLNANIRLLIEIVISAIFFGFYICIYDNTTIRLFNLEMDIKWIYGMLILFMFTGGSNASNLTDGIDGLLSGLMVIILLGFLYIAGIKQNKEVMILIVSLIGALLGFLFYNLPRAKLFMGDCGSLFLGSIIVGISIILKVESILLFFGGILIFEALSVIMQVLYFKLRKKRLFKMAPFHHHLELCGYSENKVIFIFYIINIILIILGIIYFKFFLC